MGCGSDCMSLGPPPDAILRMPPPPLPASSCPQTPMSYCPAATATLDVDNAIFPGVEYVELPRHEPSVGDDTWFLVVVTSGVALLCLAALAALFLLRCKEAYTFHFSDRSRAKHASAVLTSDLAGSSCKTASSDVPLYGQTTLDSRVLWAALTPRGTRHFVADSYPHEQIMDENHYECVDPPPYKALDIYDFEREYEEPLAYREARMAEESVSRKFSTRPLVSSPTRIERPDLPPLNLQNTFAPRSLRRASHSRRISDAQQQLDNSINHYGSQFLGI